MPAWLGRIRGAVGLGVAWAVMLGIAGGVPRWLLGVNTDVPIPLVLGAFGFVAGVTFSMILVLAEGRRSFDRMSLARFAGWGAVGGLLLAAAWARVLSLRWGDVLLIAPTFALASAACASASLALARRADARLASGGGTDVTTE
ncbi:MAG: hypothetical protein JWO05_2831 [Gemmatimonadetes bacterium]|nr:hypothetical protein [Gemmatimonadota bacterium]